MAPKKETALRTHAERMDRLQRISSLLACPHCGGMLSLQNNELVSQSCGRRYPICDGVPVLLPSEMIDQGLGGTLDADEHASIHPYSPASEELIREHADGWVLDLGAGGKHIQYSNVVQVDVFRFPMTDVVASADCLPFRNDAFNAVVSQAVFEHLQYPDAAAKEIWRVLKPDGVAKVDTAFLQPEHAYPHHYFNATEAGLKHWFRDFDIEWSGIEPYQHPKLALLWFLDVYLDSLPNREQQMIGALSIQDCLDVLKRESHNQQNLGDEQVAQAFNALAPSRVRVLAAGVSVRAIKRGVSEHATRKSSSVYESPTALQLGLERRVEQLVGEARMRKDNDRALFEMEQITADRTRYLLQYYEEPRRDVLINPGFVKPLRSLVIRELKRRVPEGLWQTYRALSRAISTSKPTLQATVFNERPAALVFIVHPEAPVSLLDMFFSLVYQTLGSWELWICESSDMSTQIRRLSWELGVLDKRVRVINSEAQVRGCKVSNWVYVPHNCILSYDAVFEIVTFAQQVRRYTCITADVESRCASVQGDCTPMRCQAQWPSGSTGHSIPAIDEVIGGRIQAEPMVVYALSNMNSTDGQVEPPPMTLEHYAHIPKVLYRLKNFSRV